MTQTETLKSHFRLRGSISDLEARGVYGIQRLATRVFELKAGGMQIQSVRRKDPTGRPYVRYVFGSAA